MGKRNTHNTDFILISDRKKTWTIAFKISLIYLIFGLCWIFFSDIIFNLIVPDPLLRSKIEVFKGIFFGLVFGKPIGILLFSFISYKFKLSNMPIGLRWRHIFLLGCLAGIGFTMSLFISKLALTSELEQIAKISVLAASIAAILLSIFYGLFLNKSKASKPSAT